MRQPNRNDQASYMTIKQVMNDLNVSKNTARKIVEEAGAVVKFGDRILRVDRNVLYEYIDRVYAEKK